MSVFDGLPGFIEARLDEDEDLARDLLHGHPGPWRVGGPSEVRDSAGELVVADEYHWNPMPHIARHDPARVLRDVAAKRRILGWANSPALPDYETGYVLDALAAAYSDHPDWRAQWAG